MTVSPQVKIFGLVAALVAVAAALALFMMKPAATEAPPAAAAVLKTRSLPAPVKQVATKPSVQPKAAVPVPVVSHSGLPASLDAALRRHRVVVVSLVVPGAAVDEISAQEARAGAALSDVGYLALNALDESVARALLTKLGPLDDASVLIFKRGGAVTTTLSGFADRETVAQAAASAS